MINVIGNSASAKFIFFSMDDVSLSPDEKEIKRLLNTKKVNLYVPNGHHRESFKDISDYLYMQKMGFFNFSHWHANGFTHVFRVDADCELNVMIELKYGHTAIAYLHLTLNLLNDLRILLRDRENLVNQINHASREKNSLIRNLNLIRELPQMRNGHLIPSESSIESIFDNYCDTEIALLKSRFDDWYLKSKWEVVNQGDFNQIGP